MTNIKPTQADRDAAAYFLEGWEPGPEMTVTKLARAFARHRIASTPTPNAGLVEELREAAQKLLDRTEGPTFIGQSAIRVDGTSEARNLRRILSALEGDRP